jgi:hypothetical protein
MRRGKTLLDFAMNIVIIVEFGDMYVCIRMGHKAGP